MTSYRAVIADDHEPTRAHVREALEADPRFTVCGEAPDAPAVVAAAERLRPDLCLLDIAMPGSGIAAAWEITARLPQTKVVMLTVSRDDDDLFSALRAGASGYLLKDVDPLRLPHALVDVLDGEAAIPRSLVARLVDEFRDRGPRRRAVFVRGPHHQRAELTRREWEVLELLREGLSTDDIAARLVVSSATVRSHVSAILRKLRVPTRKAAVALFADASR